MVSCELLRTPRVLRVILRGLLVIFQGHLAFSLRQWHVSAKERKLAHMERRIAEQYQCEFEGLTLKVSSN